MLRSKADGNIFLYDETDENNNNTVFCIIIEYDRPNLDRFYPLTFQAEGVLSLPASVCLSIRPSVCPSVNCTLSTR